MRRLCLVAIGLGGLILTGCGSSENGTPRAAGGALPPAVAASGRQTADDLPLDVSAALHRDYPDAGITNVVHSSTETGQPIYRITFIENGVAGNETYFTDGTRLPRAGAPLRDTARDAVTPPPPVTPGARSTQP